MILLILYRRLDLLVLDFRILRVLCGLSATKIVCFLA